MRHKWYVFQACRKSGLWWLGITHDWSKFRPSEFFPYAEHFYGTKAEGIKTGRDKTGYYKPTNTGDPDFDFAFFLHQKRNKHHWQYWVIPEDESGIKTLHIPNKYHSEMICDWHGASRAQGHGGKILDWWTTNGHKLQLDSFTRRLITTYVNSHYNDYDFPKE
jgi:hypothetical protein